MGWNDSGKVNMETYFGCWKIAGAGYGQVEGQGCSYLTANGLI